MGRPYKICVYAICKNEEENVQAWIENVSEADYIVVLDTGSTDRTADILEADSRVTKVVREPIIPWRFDVARNRSMELVPEDADILVCTDFDERFTPGWATELRNAWFDGATRGFYTYSWGLNSVGEPTDTFVYDKIHTRDYHWIYPVHEVLFRNVEDFEEVEVDLIDKIHLQHYRNLNTERSNYIDLLKLAVEESPEDSHIRTMYAREYLATEDYEHALEQYLIALNLPDIDRPVRRTVLLYALLHVAMIYKALKDYDESIWYCHEFIKEDSTFLDPYILLAGLYNDMQMPTLAEAMIDEGFKRCYRHNSWLEFGNTWYDWPYDELSRAKFALGDYDDAIKNIEIALTHAPNDVRLLQNARLYYKAAAEEAKSQKNID